MATYLLAKITTCFENGKSAVARNLPGGFAFGSTEYHVMRPAASIDADFLYRLISSKPFLFLGEEHMEGSAGQKRVPSDFLANFPIPVPPFDEQRAIAAFLDAMDARITRFIAARRRMIALLEEQKAAIINQAVTRGLDSHVPMKPSGIDWLGDIPAHWSVSSISRNWRVTDCKHVTVPFVHKGPDSFPLASVVQSQSFDLAGAKHTTREWYEYLIEGRRQPKVGELVFCRNVSVGSAANVVTDQAFALGQDVCLLSSPSQHSRYLNYFLFSGYFAVALERTLVGSTFRRINGVDP